MILTQAILLLILFTLRYNALYYPLIAGLAFILSKQKWVFKLGGVALGCILVGISILYTSNKMQEQTGHIQFSAFGGWQLANNALYMYQHIPPQDRKPIPQKFIKLESMVEQHFDTLSRVHFTHEDSVYTFFYLWSNKGPLLQYMMRKWEKDFSTPYFKKWASVAPLYTEYGLYLIKKYPISFTKYFLLSNSLKFALPPIEFIGVYNMGKDTVGKLAKDWFNYKSQQVANNRSIEEAKIKHAQIYPVICSIVNVFFIICLSGLVIFNGFNINKNPITRFVILILFLWVLNMLFSVFASPVVLRYQIFPMLISFSTGLIVIETIYKIGLQQDMKNKI